jgi:hypothetical protein
MFAMERTMPAVEDFLNVFDGTEEERNLSQAVIDDEDILEKIFTSIEHYGGSRLKGIETPAQYPQFVSQFFEYLCFLHLKQTETFVLSPEDTFRLFKNIQRIREHPITIPDGISCNNDDDSLWFWEYKLAPNRVEIKEQLKRYSRLFGFCSYGRPNFLIKSSFKNYGDKRAYAVAIMTPSSSMVSLENFDITIRAIRCPFTYKNTKRFAEAFIKDYRPDYRSAFSL